MCGEAMANLQSAGFSIRDDSKQFTERFACNKRFPTKPKLSRFYAKQDQSRSGTRKCRSIEIASWRTASARLFATIFNNIFDGGFFANRNSRLLNRFPVREFWHWVRDPLHQLIG